MTSLQNTSNFSVGQATQATSVSRCDPHDRTEYDIIAKHKQPFTNMQVSFTAWRLQAMYTVLH